MFFVADRRGYMAACHGSMERDRTTTCTVAEGDFALAGRLWRNANNDQPVYATIIATTVTCSNLRPLCGRSSGLIASGWSVTGQPPARWPTADAAAFGRTRSGGLWRNATSVTFSNLRPGWATSSLGPRQELTHGTRQACCVD